MSGGYGLNALQFLIGILVDLYALVLVLRFMLQATHADYYNPVAQFVVQVTGPVLRPLRRILPATGRYDVAAAIALLVVMVIKLLLYRAISIPTTIIAGYAVGIEHIWLGGLAWLAVVDAITLVINVWFFAVLIRAILSWISPGGYNPIAEVLDRITDPLLRPVRRMIPLVGGIDLSPLVVLIGLQVLKMLLVPPLLHLA